MAWCFPASMIVMLFLSWLAISMPPRTRILVTGWYIAAGAAWAWWFASMIAISSVEIGLFLSFGASASIVTGGFIQMDDQLSKPMEADKTL
jgi:hypothetical protein